MTVSLFDYTFSSCWSAKNVLLGSCDGRHPIETVSDDLGRAAAATRPVY